MIELQSVSQAATSDHLVFRFVDSETKKYAVAMLMRSAMTNTVSLQGELNAALKLLQRPTFGDVRDFEVGNWVKRAESADGTAHVITAINRATQRLLLDVTIDLEEGGIKPSIPPDEDPAWVPCSEWVNA